ncbi:hypothetical protein LTR36_006668 [Oleoguttula mirabilis]|uniref:Apple domain-containing protein n=1 Tax=Oleoguttula mirabilis TaxID=1507867 RepID=A0AAV9JBV6_9PEZI|nr:hypothetical protein LTR36_006668 [Oleoguttula mirabilis]
MLASIVKIISVAALGFASISSTTPVDLSTLDLEKRGGWTSQSTCPSGDGQEYDGPKGGAWIVRCGMDTVATTFIQQIQTDNFIDCIQACGANANCGRVTYTADVGGSGPCYLKTGGGPLTSSAGRKVATKRN